MIYFYMGLFGTLLGVLIFAIGLIIGWQIASTRKEEKTEQTVEAPEPPELSEEEKVQIAEERERLRVEQKAFHDLLGYNADVAYGVKRPAEE